MTGTVFDIQRFSIHDGPGIRTKGAIRHVAFATDDVDGIAEKVRAAGYELFIGQHHCFIKVLINLNSNNFF